MQLKSCSQTFMRSKYFLSNTTRFYCDVASPINKTHSTLPPPRTLCFHMRVAVDLFFCVFVRGIAQNSELLLHHTQWKDWTQARETPSYSGPDPDHCLQFSFYFKFTSYISWVFYEIFQFQFLFFLTIWDFSPLNTPSEEKCKEYTHILNSNWKKCTETLHLPAY